MKRPYWIPLSVVALLGLSTLPLPFPDLLAFAQEPTAVASPTPNEDESVISGTIEKFLKNDHDDVDGFLLAGGVEIHFPPHIGREVTKRVKAGDEVRVRAEKKTRRDGDVVLEARLIEHGDDRIAVEPPPPPKGAPKGKPAKGRPGNETPMNAQGKVESLATNPHGDVDGLVLEDGTVVKFPPHLGRELQALVSAGDKVRIDGRRHETPKGDIHLHADRIEAVASGRAVERHGPGSPRPEPPKGKPKPHERDGGPAAVEAGDQAQVNAEILRELRAIRRLLDEKAS